jgi:hypothetical protein
MKRLIFIMILPLFLSGCISEYGKPSAGVPAVPLIDLLNKPTRWQGKKIQVEGVFNYELEGDAIYLSKADLEQRNKEKAIFLRLDDPALRIPYGEHEKNNEMRQFFVALSLRMHIGKPASVEGVFKIAPFDGLNLSYIEVSQLILK